MRRLLISGMASFFTVGLLIIGFVNPVFASSKSSLAVKPGIKAPHTVVPHAVRDNYYAPTLTGTWHGFTDGNGQPAAWTPTNGSTSNASAVWQFSGTNGDISCQIWIYVPVGNATATIGYGFYTPTGRSKVITIDQSRLSGWIQLGTTDNNNVHQVQFTNNNGQTGKQIGVGTAQIPSLEVYCPS